MDDRFNTEGGIPPYPSYSSQSADNAGCILVREPERRELKKNYNTVFTEALIHSIGSFILANLIFIMMMFFGYEFRVNDEGTQIIDIPYEIAGTLPSMLFCIGIFIFDIASSRKKLSSYFTGKYITAGWIFGFFGMLMLMYSLSFFVQNILISGCFAMGFSPVSEEYLSESDLSVGFIICELITTALLAPIAEELMFRGVILRRLSSVSQRFAIFFSALIFGLMHGNLIQAVLGFLVGLVLGYAAVKTGSLLLPIAGHIFINTFACSTSIVTYLTDMDTANMYWIGLIGVFAVAGLLTLVALLSKKAVALPYASEYHSRRTFPVMVKCPAFWVLALVYLVSVVSKFGPVTDKLME